MSKQVSESSATMVDPGVILNDRNYRFGLKKYKVEEMTKSIVESGGVRLPIEVYPLPKDEAVDGMKYRLITGGYRLAGTMKANEEGAGLKIPAIIRPATEGAEMLKSQLSENLDRNENSPMDDARAIKALLDSGVSRQDIRNRFARPGGKKGTEMIPASNSFLNMMVSFLNFPKSVQKDIHDGKIGVKAAYELTKTKPELLQATLEQIEKDRIRMVEKEEVEELKFLTAEKKAAEARDKEETAIKELEEAKLAVETTSKLAEEKKVAAASAYAAKTNAAKEEQKKAVEHLKAAEADLKAADKAHTDAVKALDKLTPAQEEATKEVTKTAAAVVEAKKSKEATAKNTEKISSKDVQKAAAKVGSATTAAKLDVKAIREAVHDFSLPGNKFVKLQGAMKVFEEMINGEISVDDAFKKMGKITG